MEDQNNTVTQNDPLEELRKELQKIQAQLAAHEQTHENFRTSFRNLEGLITNIKDRNHLR